MWYGQDRTLENQSHKLWVALPYKYPFTPSLGVPALMGQQKVASISLAEKERERTYSHTHTKPALLH